MDTLSTKDILKIAFQEDMPSGDITTDSLALSSRLGSAKLIAKEDLVLSGRQVFEEAIRMLEPSCKLTWYFEDSQMALKGQVLCLLQGDLIQILKAERVGLNLLGHLSGIATLTRCFVDQVKHTRTNILDTRKTTPLLRDLEKKAVSDGGGTNHRKNLSEAIMIKDNHIRAAGSITNAVERIRNHSKLPLTVEASTFEEVQECVGLGVDRILLDNMDNALLTKCVQIVPAHIETEASGNMTVERVRSVAETGVNTISVGQITHSAPSADISLIFEWSDT